MVSLSWACRKQTKGAQSWEVKCTFKSLTEHFGPLCGCSETLGEVVIYRWTEWLREFLATQTSTLASVCKFVYCVASSSGNFLGVYCSCQAFMKGKKVLIQGAINLSYSTCTLNLTAILALDLGGGSFWQVWHMDSFSVDRNFLKLSWLRMICSCASCARWQTQAVSRKQLLGLRVTLIPTLPHNPLDS